MVIGGTDCYCGPLRHHQPRGFLGMTPRSQHSLAHSGGVGQPLHSCSTTFVSETMHAFRAHSGKSRLALPAILPHHNVWWISITHTIVCHQILIALGRSFALAVVQLIRHPRLYSTSTPQPSKSGCTACRFFPLLTVLLSRF